MEKCHSQEILTQNSDCTTPEEQIKQILNIAPIITGARRASKYDIPPHHPHTEIVPEDAQNGKITNEDLDSETALMDFGEADEFGPGLIQIGV